MDVTLGTYAATLGLTGWQLARTYGIPIPKIGGKGGAYGRAAGTAADHASLIPYVIGTGAGTLCGLCAGGILGWVGWLGYKASSWGGQLSLWSSTGASSTAQFHGAEAVPVEGGGALLLFVVAVVLFGARKSAKGAAGAGGSLDKWKVRLGFVNGTCLAAIPLVTYYANEGLSKGGQIVLDALNHVASTR
ncbi:hypothetical protein [Streptomyces sp. CBMA156]|uniref:hypothetical protein n=1 Tax=Streptomyces sp. CBMA156 TaxID=1930280 RepID=UPI0016619FE8|nr:hypothetical protein [Streptomyces sp. CBMA156]MBD0673478.1 hypothetical protein [Streptomyces sp. CBMA156]